MAGLSRIHAIRPGNGQTATKARPYRRPLPYRAELLEHDFEAGGGSPVDHRVSAEARAKLLDYAADALAYSAFGLHLAEQSDPRDAEFFFGAA
jgi:hypothetical protein